MYYFQLTKKSVLMVVRKYPADFGHTTVINNLCIELQKIGYKAGIGAFEFTSSTPENVEQIKLNKFKLFFHGIKILNYDVILLHQSYPSYYLLTKKPTKPVILYYHGASNRLQRINFKISMMLYKNKMTKIMAVSQSGINQMKKMIGDISAEVIYNGVDTNFYNSELPKPYKKGVPQLLFVSALRPYKKASLLIEYIPELLKKYPNIHLQIVGTGEEKLSLENLVKKLNLENFVELTGKIDNEELRLRYSSCDIYVSASTFEVCPVPTLEAMACGKPLLLFDIEPHREIIEISKAGKIFSFQKNSDFITILDEVYDNLDAHKISALKFAKSHDWKLIAQQLIKNLEKLD
jgi:glycosyltransferase involved in cell wall biosynthesis